MQLTARDKRALIGGAAVATLIMAVWLWPSGEVPGASDVELVPAAQRGGAPAPAVPAPAAAPMPAPAAAAPAAAVIPQGFELTGVTGSGAIFGFEGGGQRFVARGREVLPGLTLQGVSLYHVILAGPGGTYRLGFSGPAVALAAPGGAPAAPAPAAANAAEARQAADTQRYRAALAPREVNGRIVGYTVRAPLAPLARAGIQPGDTILSVNGSTLDAERLEELAWSIQNSTSTVFEVERGGRRVRLTLQGGGGDLRM
jgi:hypothetical protein